MNDSEVVDVEIYSIRKPCAFFFFVGWTALSLGLHVDLKCPNIEIHVPFGFFRIGWEETFNLPSINAEEINKKCFGIFND